MSQPDTDGLLGEWLSGETMSAEQQDELLTGSMVPDLAAQHRLDLLLRVRHRRLDPAQVAAGAIAIASASGTAAMVAGVSAKVAGRSWWRWLIGGLLVLGALAALLPLSRADNPTPTAMPPSLPVAPAPSATWRWPDRRPLAHVHLWGREASAENPRSFDPALVPAGADLETLEGRAAFAEHVAAMATAQAQGLRHAGYQGVLVWDLEGRQPGDTVYFGDPRRLSILAPEMEQAADRLFAAYRDAGLDTGVLLRPDLVQQSIDGQWGLVPAVDPERELADKMDWCRRRWGCRLFFISTALTRPDASGRRLPAGLVQRLSARMPDALIIIEFPSPDELGHAAGFVARDGQVPADQADHVQYFDDVTTELRPGSHMLHLLRAQWP